MFDLLCVYDYVISELYLVIANRTDSKQINMHKMG